MATNLQTGQRRLPTPLQPNDPSLTQTDGSRAQGNGITAVHDVDNAVRQIRQSVITHQAVRYVSR